MLVEMTQAGELAGEFGIARRNGAAPRAEIAAAEQVAPGDDGGAHGAILVSALRPGKLVREPEMKPILRSYPFPRSCSTAVRSSEVWNGLRSATQRRKQAANSISGNAARDSSGTS